MTAAKESLSDKFIVATVQTLFFGILLALFGYWLNLRLETYKNELTQDTERMKAILEYNEPLIQQRRLAYIEIQQAAHETTNVLEIYYYLSEEPIVRNAMRNELQSLAVAMDADSGAGRSTFVTKVDVISALEKIVFLTETNGTMLSETVRLAVQDFLEIVMSDLRSAELEENNTEAFHTAAHKRAKDDLEQLDNIINQALGVDESPIK